MNQVANMMCIREQNGMVDTIYYAMIVVGPSGPAFAEGALQGVAAEPAIAPAASLTHGNAPSCIDDVTTS